MNKTVIDFKTIEKAYGTDPGKVSDGVWKDIALIPGMRVKVAKSGNPEASKLVRALYKPYSRMLAAGQELPREKEEDISNIVMAKTILKDWSGVPGVDGETVPFTYDNAMAILSNKNLSALRDEIMQHADDFAAYKLEFIEESKKK